MPNFYTAAVADGSDFEKFVMLCAHEFLPISYISGPIPERFEQSDSYMEKIHKVNIDLDKLCVMSDDEANVAATKEFSHMNAITAKYIERSKALHEKYEAMLEKVRAWTPPTPDHEGLKHFMVKQLAESIKFDCREDLYEKRLLNPETGQEWRARRMDSLRNDLHFYIQRYAEEVKRTEMRNQWLQALRADLAAYNKG